MKFRYTHLYTLIISLALLTACTPKATPTPVDLVGTRSAELAASMLTQTVAAYSPTPLPATATPTFTATPAATETPAATSIPKVMGPAPCYEGPGPSYKLTSNIHDAKLVEIFGVSNIPGWYLIMNPYFHTKCFIEAKYLTLDPNFDASVFPTVVK